MSSQANGCYWIGCVAGIADESKRCQPGTCKFETKVRTAKRKKKKPKKKTQGSLDFKKGEG